MKFTLSQINSVRANVKTGADFPKEIQEFKALGIIKYEFFLESGICIYHGDEKFHIKAPTEYASLGIPSLKISAHPSLEKFRKILLEHQTGKSDFPTFCKQSANAGVNKWICDLIRMNCTYFDSSGQEMLSEKIPNATELS